MKSRGDPSTPGKRTISFNRRHKRIRYIILSVLGIFFTITGIVGIFVPVLPTTVFFIIASGLFIKTNPWLYRWLHNNRVTGNYLRVYTLGEGMSRERKIRSIAVLWISLLISSWFVRDLLWLLAVLAIVGIAVTLHISTVKSRKISPEKLAAHERIMNHISNDIEEL